MRNEICSHCEYKRGICAMFPCKVYKNAQLKRAERRLLRKFGDDYDAEDRYEAGLMLASVIVMLITLVMVLCTIKVIGEWWLG